MHRNISLLVLSLSLFPASIVSATVVYNESVSGDISGTPSAPTAVTLSAGTNSVVGSLRTSSSTDNQDFLTVNVPAGLKLSQYILAAYSSTDSQGFTGFQVASSFVGSVNSTTSYAGYSHYGTAATNGALPTTNLVGQDLFPIMEDNSPGGSSSGALGFTAPLDPGSYTFLIQQTGTAVTSYQFDFVTIPEPASLSLFSLLLAPLFRRRR